MSSKNKETLRCRPISPLPLPGNKSRLWRFGSNRLQIAILLCFSFFISLALTPDMALGQSFSKLFKLRHHQESVSRNNNLLRSIAVFGKDQRQRLPARYKKLNREIGLLQNIRTNTLCTAFCVGPDVIATASHCLFNNRKSRNLYLSALIFRLDTAKRRSALYSKLAGNRVRQTRQYVIAGTSRLNRKPPIGAAHDWALARLARPICKNGWLKSRSLSNAQLEKQSQSNKLFQVAYHMDYGNWQIAYSRSCSVKRNYGGLLWRNIKQHFSAPDSLILHRCDTGAASSGSPLLMDSKDGPLVIGINVGTYQQRQITKKNGRIISRTKFQTIANTGVNATEFAAKIALVEQANIIGRKKDLKKLQQKLFERGFYQGNIDGLYGARTELAIKSLERGMNLPVTGLATISLLKKLGINNSEPASIFTSAGHKASVRP